MTRLYSLKKTLLSWILIPIFLLIFLTMIIGGYFVWHEIEEIYDAQMVHSAKVLLQLTEHEIQEDEGFHLGIENQKLSHPYEKKTGFRIWHQNDLIAGSGGSEFFSGYEFNPGFSNQEVDGKQWRFFVFLEADKGIKIEVSEDYEVRFELVLQLMITMVLPILVFIPIVMFLMWIGIRKALKPMTLISENVDHRNSDDLSAIEFDKLPAEVYPLVSALNKLFIRIENNLKNEREFTDNAAHELRTPLAAMKTQTQVLLKKLNCSEEEKSSLINLEQSIDRATRMVEQLLSFARIQSDGSQLIKGETNLSILIKESLDQVKSSLFKKSLTFDINVIDQYKINGNLETLSVLFKNLFENAVKYSPDKTTISVCLDENGLFTLSDQGVGVSDDQKGKIFNRFARFDQTGIVGSGLGMSIVKWIADDHGLNIQLKDNNPNGLIVEIQF